MERAKKRCGQCIFCGKERSDKKNKRDFLCENCYDKYAGKIVWFCAECKSFSILSEEQFKNLLHHFPFEVPVRKGIILKESGGCPKCDPNYGKREKTKGEVVVYDILSENFS
jgi:hypothetical protein